MSETFPSAAGAAPPAGSVEAPFDTAETAEVLRAAAAAGQTVRARGNGTKLDWGPGGFEPDLVVDTRQITELTHTAGDLVVRVGAGIGVSELQQQLAQGGQRLSVAPPVAGSSVGGMVATALSGPPRHRYGPVRDLIIGMTVARADGRLSHSGGTVVKNVAGYDLAKLHTGAYGSLGLITSVTFKLHPLPETQRVLTATTSDPKQAEEWLRRLHASQSEPTAIELETLDPDHTDSSEVAPAMRLHVLLEGAAGGMDARVAATAAAMDGADVHPELPAGWAQLPGTATATQLQLVVPPAHSVATVRELHRLAGADLRLQVRGSAGTGVLYAAVADTAEPTALSNLVENVRTRLAEQGGSGAGTSVTVLRPAATLRDTELDLWGEIPGLALMRAIKHQLDPDRRLSPGRGPGGL